MKVERVDSVGGALYGYRFRCPGCGNEHLLPTQDTPGEVHARWTFNGDVSNPVFSPSILARGDRIKYDDKGEWTGEWELDEHGKTIPYVCHSFVGINGAAPGFIQFLGDCTHALANQVVELPDIKEAL